MRMISPRRQFLWTLAAAGASLLAGQVFAQENAKLREPVYRVAANIQPQKEGEHPLDSALRFAEENLVRIQKDIDDYECLIVKRERIKGVLNEHEYMYAKVRNRKIENGVMITPLSVYLNFQKPASVKGREVIWVEGKNNGKLCAHEGGLIGRLPAVWLDPKGPMAMRGNLYPISDIGIENLVAKLIERGTREKNADATGKETIVETTQGAKVNGRKCTVLSIKHTVERPNYEFQLAQVFIDDELNLPIRYVAFGWPERGEKGDKILEEYNYTNIKVNVGLKDADFDPANPNYRYRGVGNPAQEAKVPAQVRKE